MSLHFLLLHVQKKNIYSLGIFYGRWIDGGIGKYDINKKINELVCCLKIKLMLLFTDLF